MNKKIRIFKIKNRFFWLINFIMFNLIKIFPRDKKIWVYGAWLGNKYADNAKYFFEYMNSYHPEIRSIWITKNKEIKKYLKNKGYEVYNHLEIKGIWFRLRAGVQLYTNGLFDFGNVVLCGGAYIIALWHGMPIKKITYDEVARNNTNKIIIFLKNIKIKLFNECYRNMSICTSNFMLKNISSAFRIKKDNIVITGQPRNDVFIKNLDKKNVLAKFVPNITNKKKIILYLPTYRTSDDSSRKFNNFLNNLINNKELIKLLEDSDSYLLIKWHLLAKNINEHITNRIIFLNDNNVDDVQELLAVSDIHVTDYSSSLVDFLLLERPVIFLAPDLKEYISKENGLYIDYNYLAGELKATNSKEFVELLYKIMNDNISYLQHIKKLNNLFNEKQSCNFSENVYNKVVEKLKLYK
ncbi:CDP-glycerol glycerophosphotransferase family protein [Defluviitalea phaphyphila]|uniref:CDP-glycerol glycerophosphotransferase family protein n=1 Tax=Defluviitalea phaphyphila TaxID=1473580 RepID=UPI00073125BE|nr:CDP-glycerol glycerophosphotransferase family protein [Defluviitalea phaphyphila]